MKFKKKPVIIEAVKWTGTDQSIIDIMALVPKQEGLVKLVTQDLDELRIAKLEGVMPATLNDWIIRGVQGELYPCKPDIFNETYEIVEE